LLARAQAFAQAHQIDSDADLGPVFDLTPHDADPDVMKRLRQMYEAGGWVLLESTLADLPADLRWLYESGAVTIEQLTALHRSLNVTTAADLAAAIREQTIADVPGFDATTEEAVRAALPKLRASIPRIPLGLAVNIAEPLLTRLRAAPGVAWAEPAGSLRRGQDTVGDIDIVAACADPAGAMRELLGGSEAFHCLHRGDRRVCVLRDRVQVEVRFPDPANAGATLLYLTGSAQHFEGLRAHAASKGWHLAASGLSAADGSPRAAATEEEIYATLGLACIPPEIRNGTDEIEAAAAGTLPALVARRDIRGDLHMHTTWSDGRDSVEAMVQQCRALGYSYMAITDHSPHSAASRNLTADGARKQADEIAALRERYPDIAILHGCEVDILQEGRLDFPDRTLERFYIVLASLHESAGNSSGQLMKRYESAMKHPLVALITHPTNRLVPYRAGYDLDYDRLFEIAVETDTALEVDGSPAHLDLDGALARRAIAAGATVMINSDCHRAEMLDRQMRLGIATARRGWVEPRHVLNTRPVDDVRAFIARKRDPR
jgi:DNA polymerase (family 10)